MTSQPARAAFSQKLLDDTERLLEYRVRVPAVAQDSEDRQAAPASAGSIDGARIREAVGAAD